MFFWLAFGFALESLEACNVESFHDSVLYLSCVGLKSRVDCDDVFAVARVFCLGSVGGEIDLEKMKREYDESVVKEYSFAPAIDSNSKQLMLKYEQRPLHERYDEVVKNKQTNLQQMRMENEKRETNMYKPHINKLSKEMYDLHNCLIL